MVVAERKARRVSRVAREDGGDTVVIPISGFDLLGEVE